MMKLLCVYNDGSMQFSYTNDDEFKKHLTSMQANGYELYHSSNPCSGKFGAIYSKKLELNNEK